MTLPNGYKMTTTFFEDFNIANAFGNDAIKDTYDNAFFEWKENYIYMTELVIVLSNNSIYWYNKDRERSMLYSELYSKLDEYCINHFRGKAIEFYYRVTD